MDVKGNVYKQTGKYECNGYGTINIRFANFIAQSTKIDQKATKKKN